MKNLIFVLSVFLAVSSTAIAQTVAKPSKESSQKSTYTCPMHSDEVSMAAGKCSKCGMELVKTKKLKHNSSVKGSQASTVVEAKYVCKMDGTTSEKACKCPKCGMEMSKNETQKAAYACPMHPKVTGKQADKCSKCGMELSKVGGEEKDEDHKH